MHLDVPKVSGMPDRPLRQLAGGEALPRLTALRGLAAMWAFLYHFGFNLRVYWAFRWFADGYTSVAFFFVLSGFVLTWISQPGDSVKRYYRRRVARIYPTYAVACAIALIITPAAWTASVATFGLVQSWFAVVPAGARTITFPVNPPAWSLSCEAAFYAFFPVMMWARHRMRWKHYALLMLVWIMLCLQGAVLAIRIGSVKQGADIVYFTPFIRIGEFAIGSAVAVLVRSGWRPRIPIRFIPAAILMVVAATVLRHSNVEVPRGDLVMLPFFALLVFAAALADIDRRPGILRWRPFVYAGEVSYAFYIIQIPIFIEVVKYTSGGHAAMVLAVLVPVSAILLHQLVERPFQRWISRGRLLRTAQTPPPPPPVAPDQDRLVGSVP